MVDADKAGAVGEDSLDLQEVDHVGYTLHDLLFFRTLAASCITSSTVFPSLAPSRAQDVIYATYSG